MDLDILANPGRRRMTCNCPRDKFGVKSHEPQCEVSKEIRSLWTSFDGLPRQGGFLLSPGEQEARRAQEGLTELWLKVEALEYRVKQLEDQRVEEND